MEKKLTVKEMLKEVDGNLLPKALPKEILNYEVKEWARLDDDVTGDYTERLVFKMEGDELVRNILLKKFDELEKEQRDELIDRVANGDREAEREIKQYFEKEYVLEMEYER
ncbi:hypothetical protein [Parageobacillus thermoglucosidasius]|uniref:Phage protein n=1 Tax=Parageobacillus thermoglucosidasius TaxID=1426 RepID=A0AB38R6B1_PARTM|nr:hypothetical protein [Parageobacillus thermoglucosidasius]UOE78385.1 hypothetical protein IMI45_20325 [Parageobacillus thermoglucosidasius]